MLKPIRKRTLFIYWGRRGALSQFLLELSRLPDNDIFISISRQNEIFQEISRGSTKIIAVDTFAQSAGAILLLPRLACIRRQLRDAILALRIERVVVLMSHVWTPFISTAVKKLGVEYAVVVHDAESHSGDRTAIVNRWLLEDAFRAEEIITLSQHVAHRLIQRFPFLRKKIRVLFHPILTLAEVQPKTPPTHPLGFLFMGRLLAYKGAPLFVEACEILRKRGFNFRILVAGEGALGPLEPRLKALNAEIVNRWLAHDEIPSIAARCDGFVVSHIEASQSGVISMAHGFGLPVITTPVGGLLEQVEDGETGVVARNVSALALADAMQQFLIDDALRARLRQGVAKLKETHSMQAFARALTTVGSRSS